MKRWTPLLLAIGILCAIAAPASAQKALRLGILPDADSLPFLVAEAESLFQAEGVQVALVRFQNPIERDAAFQAGAVDGVIGDTLAAALAAQGGFKVKITSLTDGRYGIVAAPTSGIKNLSELADKPIGSSLNSIINYAIDIYMREAGVPAARIKLMPLPKMPVRLEMLLAGQIAAAGLPEPLLTVAQLRGARLLVSSDDTGLDAAVLLFSAHVLDTRLPELVKLYKAYWRAACALNAAPDTYRSMLSAQAGFSAEAAAAWRFVVYRKPRLPSIQAVTRVLTWMREKGLLKTELAPESLLDARPTSGW